MAEEKTDLEKELAVLREGMAPEDSENLDTLVHDAKGDEAAAINNGGVDDQIEYLQSYLGLEPLVKLLSEMRAEKNGQEED